MKTEDHWIRSGRKRRGLSQANLARVTGIKQAKISQWELLKSKPSLSQAKAIKTVFSALDAGEIPEGLLLRNHRRAAATAEAKKRGQTSRHRTSKKHSQQCFEPVFLDGPAGAANSPTVLACFAGCGGMALGFEQAGFTARGFVELDTAACETFKKNFPRAVQLAGDIRDVGSEHADNWREHLGPIDVLCGGPPCQGFSLAGKRDSDDHRNSLFRDYLRVAERLGPKIVVMENVRLLTSMKAPDGRLMVEHIYEEFARAGFAVRHTELNAQDYGVPQFRERVFFVAVRNDLVESANEFFPNATHGNNKMLDLFSQTLAPLRTFRDATGDLEVLESGERSASDDLHWAVKHPDHVIRWLRDVPEGASAHENDDPELRPPSGYNTTYKRLRWDEPSSTIGTTFGMISACRTVHPAQTRSLTIREALRCQTFPDNFRVVGNAGQMRTQVGNAVPPLLAKTIASHLFQRFFASFVGRANRSTYSPITPHGAVSVGIGWALGRRASKRRGGQ